MSTTVRSSSKNAGNSATPSVVAPSGVAAGDVVTVTITHNAEAGLSDNNGATPFTEDLEFTPSFAGFGRLAVYSRRILAGDPGTYNFTAAGGANRWSAVAVAFQNPHSGTIYDRAPIGNDSGTVAGTIGTASSINTTDNNSLHVIMGNTDGANNIILSDPGGYTSAQNVGTQQCQAVSYKVITPAGATGAQTYNYTASSTWVSINYAVKDETAGAVTGINSYKTLLGVGL